MADPDASISLLLRTLPLPAFLARHDGSLLRTNPAFDAVVGQSGSGAPVRTLFGLGVFTTPDDLRSFIGSFRYGGEVRTLTLPPDGRIATTPPLLLSASLLEYAEEKTVCGILSRAGATGKIGQDLGQNGADALLDQVDRCVARVGSAGELLFLNLPLRSKLGWKRADSLPTSWLELDAQLDDNALRERQSEARTQGSARFDTYLRRKDGSLIPVEIVLRPTGGTALRDQFIVTAHDLSDRMREQRERQVLRRELERLTVQLARRSVPVGEKPPQRNASFRIISQSPAYKKILRQINRVAATDSTVLITGETGTGKELIARSIHARSQRASRPLLVLNCAALPGELIESELFGYRKGAFTGAGGDHPGRFELADEGTIFLDEIGEMPVLLQTRLLRVLQDGEFTPLGAKESMQSNVRIIAATNRNLRDRVADGTFRADLYFRLNVFPIHSIPLRDRPEDIPILVDHFIRKYAGSPDSLPTLRPVDLKRLQDYRFEGNVRELENIIQRALIISDGDYLSLHLDDLDEPPVAGSTTTGGLSPVLNFTEMQRQHIIRVLEMTNGKVSGAGGAAELLGLNPQTLFSKMRKLKISRRRDRYS